MTIYVCDWPELVTLVIDDVSEARAREVAREVHGTAPSRVRALPPRTLVCELRAEDGPTPADGDVIVLEPLPHVLVVLGDLLEDEGAAPPATHLRVVPIAPAADASVRCESEADAPDGTAVRCDLPRGHGKHHSGGAFDWVTK